MEDNIYKIQENINRIFIEIEENAGEITEEQLEQLNINQENLKQKLSDYNKAIQLGTQALEIRKKVLGEKHPDYAI